MVKKGKNNDKYNIHVSLTLNFENREKLRQKWGFTTRSGFSVC